MIQYKWGKYWKPSGSMFLGTSPEFDFAVYTLCFLAKPGENACDFLIGDCTDVQITSHAYNQKDQTFVGSIFPFPGKVVENCKISSPTLPSPAATTQKPANKPAHAPEGPTKVASFFGATKYLCFLIFFSLLCSNTLFFLIQYYNTT